MTDITELPFQQYIHVIFYDGEVVAVSSDDTTIEMLKQQDSRFHTEEVRLL
jgi:hypothetical protein